MGGIELSLVIPVYNEAGSLPELYRQIKSVSPLFPENYEVLYVDDGSTDGSSEILGSLADLDRRIKVIRFPKNLGQHKALEAAFREARGDIVVTMDADLQNNPADIPAMTAKIKEGYDLVCGWRQARRDNILKRLKSRAGNCVQMGITKLRIHDMSGTMRAYKSGLVKGIKLRRYDISILPLILGKKTDRITELKILHRGRLSGKSKYPFMPHFLGTIRSYVYFLLKTKNRQAGKNVCGY